MGKPTSLPWTGDAAADRLLADSPLALLMGMLLDQQFKMEMAFAGPHVLQQRMGEDLDAAKIAAMDPDEFVEFFRIKPAIHRFPASMGKRTHELCEALTADYGGDAEQVWAGAKDGKDLYDRLRALPGFGDAKSRIFVGVLGKRMGVGPEGWEEYAADWPSIADIDAFEKIENLRLQKRAAKAAAKQA